MARRHPRSELTTASSSARTHVIASERALFEHTELDQTTPLDAGQTAGGDGRREPTIPEARRQVGDRHLGTLAAFVHPDDVVDLGVAATGAFVTHAARRLVEGQRFAAVDGLVVEGQGHGRQRGGWYVARVDLQAAPRARGSRGRARAGPPTKVTVRPWPPGRAERQSRGVAPTSSCDRGVGTGSRSGALGSWPNVSTRRYDSLTGELSMAALRTSSAYSDSGRGVGDDPPAAAERRATRRDVENGGADCDVEACTDAGGAGPQNTHRAAVDAAGVGPPGPR